MPLRYRGSSWRCERVTGPNPLLNSVIKYCIWRCSSVFGRADAYEALSSGVQIPPAIVGEPSGYSSAPFHLCAVCSCAIITCGINNFVLASRERPVHHSNCSSTTCGRSWAGALRWPLILYPLIVLLLKFFSVSFVFNIERG